jgi:hypothetical protein
MKTWIIASIILGLLVIGGFAVVSAISNPNISESSIESTAETISCSGCENGCTTQRNCGLATCGAVIGTGSCGCGK